MGDYRMYKSFPRPLSRSLSDRSPRSSTSFWRRHKGVGNAADIVPCGGAESRGRGRGRRGCLARVLSPKAEVPINIIVS